MPYLIIIAIILILGALLKLPVVKGMIGEWIVRIAIGRNSSNPEKPKRIINNLLLEISPERTSQIDHVVINSAGVFVIETKNYSGRIYGSDPQQNWTQVLNYGRVKNHFYSPIKQNQTHVYAIHQLLPHGTPIIPLVVFVKGNVKYIQSENVYTVWGLVKKLKKAKEKKIAPEQIDVIYNTLIQQNKSKTIRNSQHVKNIEKMKNNIENGICPRCGNTLVLRHGKSGDFMGCSNYPSCRFTKKVE